jgi:membrane protein implicated in regulation of membrane protease activity
MGPYIVQHWLVWGIVVALLMLGAWMRMGFYLFYLGLAALLALVEALFHVRLRWQLASFVAASAILAYLNWAIAARCGRGGPPRVDGAKPPVA